MDVIAVEEAVGFETVVGNGDGNAQVAVRTHMAAYAEVIQVVKRRPQAADSRGLEASAGRNEGAISKFALERLTLLGLSPGAPIRFPIQLEEKDLQEASLIVAINRVEHQPMMQKQFPAWAGRITYWDVADLNITDAENALPALEERIHSLLESLRSNLQNQS